MKFLKGFLVFILMAIIIGGVGYIGYTFLFMGGMDHSSINSSQTQQTADANANSNQDQQNTQGMQHGSMNNQQQQNNNQQSANNQIALNQSNLILQNKEKLDKSTALVNEALRLMTTDPYAPGSNNMSNMQSEQKSGILPDQSAHDGMSDDATIGNNTIINIYPQDNNLAMQPNTMAQSSVMQNMGISYDATKMEQLHTGLYKIAVGKALLEQLNSELVYQAEYAAGNAQDLVQYFSNQYNLTVQNKNKLNQALTYINEAANLVNINPYISSTGLVYDKERMNQLHQSIQKLAEGVASLNQLNDDFTKQTILLVNTVQNYINNANNLNNQQMNHAAIPTGLFGGLFGNINIGSVVNIVLILFVIGLVAGIFGFISSLFKSPVQRSGRKEEII